MYCIYISKNKGDKTPFEITNLIEKYMEETDYRDSMICAPGFLSKEVHTIKEFISNISGISLRDNRIGFFRGMNGAVSVSGGGTVIDRHLLELSMSGKETIDIMSAPKQDHRKMIFFFRENKSFKDPLCKSNCMDFLDQIQVNAILVGSSNQSWNTYYGGKKHEADKGEADMFLFRETNFFNRVLQVPVMDQMPRYVVFESRSFVNDEDYFKNIMRDFLENALD